MTGQTSAKRPEFISYVIGYGVALLLTGAAFSLVHWRIFSLHSTLGVVFGLALLQIIVHFRFFLHLRFARSTRADLHLVLFSTLIILLMVGGTLVVLTNLRARMM